MPDRLHADEVAVDDDLVRALVDRHEPAWASLPLRRLATTGTDNAIYRLGPDLAVRLPRIHWAQHQVDLEHEWLPRLAPSLPVAVPQPVAVGEPDPGRGYPFRWLAFRWLVGADALATPVADWTALAVEVAEAVVALRRVEPARGPAAHGRTGPRAPFDRSVRRFVDLRAGRGELDRDRALAVWDAGRAAEPWTGPPTWAHGDLLPGNLLVRRGRLAGIIDWSAASVGDPSVDVMLAWSLPPPARAAYRSCLDVDDASWARARARSLEQAVHFIPYYDATIPDAVAAARRRLAAILADD